MRIALFGFPMTGKSTLFQLLTGIEISAHKANPGEAHVGIAKVSDPRLDVLSEMYSPKKTTPATIEYLDLVGMQKGEAAKVLPLEKLRAANALAHVVRAFEDDAIPHAEGPVDPARDVATMETELILADYGVAERRIEKLELLIKKTNRDEDKKELALVRRVLEHLEQDQPLRNMEFSTDEEKTLRGFTFLSLKPLLIVVNAGEGDVSMLGQGPEAFGLAKVAAQPETDMVALSAKIESEISHLDAEFAEGFRKDLGIEEPALERMIRVSYRLLQRISFFTVGQDECRAWRIRKATRAQDAAGTIHSDISKGFIRAEVLAYKDLMDAGSWNHARDRGTVRLEGKAYLVEDGDIANFRFNV
jgi:GTP-binding protein YchF